jgi:Domain of unknown function (DUF4388)
MFVFQPTFYLAAYVPLNAAAVISVNAPQKLVLHSSVTRNFAGKWAFPDKITSQNSRRGRFKVIKQRATKHGCFDAMVSRHTIWLLRHSKRSRYLGHSTKTACDKLRRPRRVLLNKMATKESQTEHLNEIDAALLDAELFVKYKAPEKAIKRLRTALDRNSRSLILRERLREIYVSQKHSEEAARQCLALASLYIERDDLDTAHDRLLEAKQLDERINIAGGLEAIRRARRPDLKPAPAAAPSPERRQFTLAGDLSAVSVFDAVQVIENARLTGVLTLAGQAQEGRVLFNEGRIVDAEAEGENSDKGFQRVCEITSGTFEFLKSEDQFPIRIEALSNTNLILDTLRLLDEQKQ